MFWCPTRRMGEQQSVPQNLEQMPEVPSTVSGRDSHIMCQFITPLWQESVLCCVSVFFTLYVNHSLLLLRCFAPPVHLYPSFIGNRLSSTLK